MEIGHLTEAGTMMTGVMATESGSVLQWAVMDGSGGGSCGGGRS
jgi:hypothetical protein